MIPRRMFSKRRRKSSRFFAKQRMAMISEATEMSKPLSRTTPLPAPKPITTLRRARSLTSSTRPQ
ncbi:hypothetical protein EVA_11613 [gut metagenome]|uniref:Uncharacterized protein n=1 Tax=gut metagenome TaxID=749906 RepID=J9FZ75_9ZZZZ